MSFSCDSWSREWSTVQKDLSRLEEQANRDFLKFSKGKDNVPHLGRKHPLQQYRLAVPGRWADREPAVALAARSTNNILGCVSRSTGRWSREGIILLCPVLIRLHQSHCSPLWTLQCKKNIDKLECVVEATRMVRAGAPALWVGRCPAWRRDGFKGDLTASPSAYREIIKGPEPGSS